MGQYYRIFMCKEDGSEPRVHSSYDHDNNGAKLMEHSYYGNRFVEAALAQLVDTYKHHDPLRVWWVGDYAEEDDIPEDKKQYHPIAGAWKPAPETIKVHNEEFDFGAQLYLVNLTTHEYIDLKAVREQNKVPGWSGSIHPLPLLTAVGNGRGGGDYHGSAAINKNMVGAWAGDLLQITETIPQDEFLMYIDISSDVHFQER